MRIQNETDYQNHQKSGVYWLPFLSSSFFVVTLFFLGATINAALSIIEGVPNLTVLFACLTTLFGILCALFVLCTVITRKKQSLSAEINSFRKSLEQSFRRVHVSWLEKYERQLCKNNEEKANILIFSNNLTCDREFIDEMEANIAHGSSYVYIVSEEAEKSATALRKEVYERFGEEKRPPDDQFQVLSRPTWFLHCPTKYTVVIYDIKNETSHFVKGEIKGYCCAQESTELEDLYYFELTEAQTKKIIKAWEDAEKEI